MVIIGDWIMEKKIYPLLLIVILMCTPAFSSASDESCAICGSNGEECWTDDFGAVYCGYTLKHFPAEQSAVIYHVDKRARSIGSDAFSENHTLRHVSIPEGVAMIEDSAFATSTIQSVTLPESLLVIGENAFGMCHSLVDVKIPSHIYAIGREAFVECSLLQSITIPASVRYIGIEAFVKTSIRDVYFETVLCCVEEPFISHTASSTGVMTLHFVEWAEDDEIGDVNTIIDMFSDKPDVTVLYDVKNEG